MTIRKATIIFLLCLFTNLLSAQRDELVNLGTPVYVRVASSLPEGLTSTRSVAIISTPKETIRGYQTRGSWKKLAEEVHKNLRKIGVDPVSYLYEDDLNAGPEVRNSYYRIFKSRNIRNLILVQKTGELPDEQFSMQIIPLDDNGRVPQGQITWKEESTTLESLFLRLGRQVLRQELVRANFLIPEQPEYLTDLAVFTGNRLENFPSRIRSLPIAITQFQKVSDENVQDAEVLQRIKTYNEEVDKKNQSLREILALYPFKYELVDVVDNDALYQKGFQYVLVPLCSNGKTVKKILNYPSNKTETDYISNTIKNDGKTELLKIPVDAEVCKFYIKQTIVGDIHVGDDWDAIPGWESSLRNFVLNLRSAFNLPLGANQ